ncbi:MAG: CinA family protein [Hyphomicrobium sp.]|uniref:CinA family protein n=1 Tax=Hyphomicrobium sp. TaxID=82 RepID=UPI003568F539
MFPSDIETAAGRVVAKLRTAGFKVATAESCTGGLIAGAITSVAGSSDVFDQGFVTYADTAKTAMIGVDAGLIEAKGAVSAEVGRAMAEGALKTAAADVAVAVTGIAGPGGAMPGKPVGLVFIALASRKSPTHVQRFEFSDIGREGVRLATVREALKLLERAGE